MFVGYADINRSKGYRLWLGNNQIIESCDVTFDESPFIAKQRLAPKRNLTLSETDPDDTELVTPLSPPSPHYQSRDTSTSDNKNQVGLPPPSPPSDSSSFDDNDDVPPKDASNETQDQDEDKNPPQHKSSTPPSSPKTPLRPRPNVFASPPVLSPKVKWEKATQRSTHANAGSNLFRTENSTYGNTPGSQVKRDVTNTGNYISSILEDDEEEAI